MTWIIIETAIPVFILMVIGIWITAKEFKKDLDDQKKDMDNDEKS